MLRDLPQRTRRPAKAEARRLKTGVMTTRRSCRPEPGITSVSRRNCVHARSAPATGSASGAASTAWPASPWQPGRTCSSGNSGRTIAAGSPRAPTATAQRSRSTSCLTPCRASST